MMTKYRLILFLIMWLNLLLSCDKGLAPFLNQNNDHKIPSSQNGGNPVGFWVPDTLEPVEVTILDESKIPSMVDSLSLNSNLEGSFAFYPSTVCSVMAVMTIHPTVYMLGSTSPLHAQAVTDTIQGDGYYEIIGDSILCLPVQSNHFNIDTLYYTVTENDLMLLTQENTFNYMQLVEIPLYFTFHLMRLN